MVNHLITALKNAHSSRNYRCIVSRSAMTERILQLLLVDGYISGFTCKRDLLYIYLKPLPLSLIQVSKSGKRIYRSYRQQQPHQLISTTHGVLTARKAQALKVGGEVILT